jgi:hypothetical protein
LDYTVTTIPAVAFVPDTWVTAYHTSGSIARMVDPSPIQVDFYSGLDIPAGAVIDFIGFNNLNDGTPNIMAIHLLQLQHRNRHRPLLSGQYGPHVLGDGY